MIDILHKYANVHTNISKQPACNIRKLIDEIGSKRIVVLQYVKRLYKLGLDIKKRWYYINRQVVGR